MGESFKALAGAKNLPFGVLLGAIIGLLVFDPLKARFGSEFKLGDAMLVAGLVGALAHSLFDSLLIKPFVSPWIARRDLIVRLLESTKLKIYLTPASADEVYKKVILAYLLPGAPKEKSKDSD
jgi:hypothetical protein